MAEGGEFGESQFQAIWEAEWKQHRIDVAAERVKSRVSAKQFQVFFLHVLKGLSASEVVQRLKVTRTQVYLAKLRVGRLFQQELRAVRSRASLPLRGERQAC